MKISLRIRHPSIDPALITEALGLEPEYCFKAGELREASTGGNAGHHVQTYWLAPARRHPPGGLIEPSFLEAIAARYPSARVEGLENKLRAAKAAYRDTNVEAALYLALLHLNARSEFLRRLQDEGGDMTLLIALPAQLTHGFRISVAISRLVAKLGLDLEFDAG